MNQASPKSLLDRALWVATTIVVATLLLSWAWSLLRPLLPVLTIAGVLVVLGRWWLRRWRF